MGAVPKYESTACKLYCMLEMNMADTCKSSISTNIHRLRICNANARMSTSPALQQVACILQHLSPTSSCINAQHFLHRAVPGLLNTLRPGPVSAVGQILDARYIRALARLAQPGILVSSHHLQVISLWHPCCRTEIHMPGSQFLQAAAPESRPDIAHPHTSSSGCSWILLVWF